MKRIISVALLTAMLILSVSCSANNAKNSSAVSNETSDTTNFVSDNINESQVSEKIPDMLPEKDFNGKVFRVAVEPDKEYEIMSETTNGEITNDAIYNRNILIEDRFNAKIETIAIENTHDNIVTTVTAGDDAYDMAGTRTWNSYIPIVAHALVNWYDIPYVNLDQPWYYKVTNDSATFNGKLFGVTSYLAITTLLDTYAMFFNEKICSDFGYTASDLYNLVYDNKWTYDKFNEILSQIYVDVNGDGKHDKDDIHGYVGGLCHPLDIWLAAFDQPLTSKDSNGNLQIQILTEKTVSALEKIYELTYNNPASFRQKIDYSEYAEFAAGHAAFTPLPFHTTFAELREMEDPYGILPLPKWDSEQPMYRTHIYDQYTTYNIPKTVPEENYEFIGIMMEALCAESYNSVYPAYYEVALKNKYAADKDAAKMIDIIMEGAGMDFAYIFSDNLMRVSFLFRDLINNNSTDITSQMKKIEKPLSKAIEKLYEYYED